MQTIRLSGLRDAGLTPTAIGDDCTSMLHYDASVGKYLTSSNQPYTGNVTYVVVSGSIVQALVDGSGNYQRAYLNNGVPSGAASTPNPCAAVANLTKTSNAGSASSSTWTGNQGIGTGTTSTVSTTGIGGANSPTNGSGGIVNKGDVQPADTPVGPSCPCVTTEVPVNYYVSLVPTPNSQVVHGSVKKVVCQQTPDGTPAIPCDELKTAVQKLGTGTATTGNPSSAMSGLAREATNEILSRPVASALELGAAVGVAIAAQRRFKLPLWATVGVGLVTALAAGKVTDNISI